jgi:hypothetical protein
MNSASRLLRFSCALSVVAFALTYEAASAADYTAGQAFVKQHCVDCHSGSDAANGLHLDTLGGDLGQAEVLSKWVAVYDRVARGEMPPKDSTQPTAAERTAFLAPLRDALFQASSARAQTVLRRLNRAEYERTLNDLLGTTVSVIDMLPEDGRAFGFDNIGESLDLSPVQLQRYMEAAGKALDAAVSTDEKPESKLETYFFGTGRNADNVGKQWHRREDGAVVFYSDSGYPPIKVQEFRIPTEGRYHFRLYTSTHQSDAPIVYGVYLGADSQAKPATLHGHFTALPGPPVANEFDAYMWKGHTLRIFPRDLKKLPGDAVRTGIEKYKGPGLAITKMEVEGPFIDEWPRRGHLLRFGDLEFKDMKKADPKRPGYMPRWELVAAKPEADVAGVLPAFVAAAFRRPVSTEEVQPFVDLARAELAAGAKIEQALRTAQVAVLTAPEFLFLLEKPGRLDDYAVASRLSYMLWGTTPDAELLALAAKRSLTQPETLRSQTERLLRDPRGRHFTTNFINQWLNLREIDFTTPDRQLYPEFDDVLKRAIVDETELFFTEVLNKNSSLLNFVASDWTFLNERLAKHYRIADVNGVEMRKVSLKPEDHRGGVLTQASVLKVSANGTTTSPVVRGAWVLQRILGIDPPPPPPGVPGVEPDIRGATTLRETLEKHRSNETCNNCHKTIDPPGFALESYDVIGGLRTNYRSLGKDFPAPKREETDGRSVQWRVGPPVDSSGTTAEGRHFANLAGYKKLLLAEPNTIAKALTVKLATYGAGRGMEFSDRAELDKIVEASAAKNYGFRDLLHFVIQSNLFLNK